MSDQIAELLANAAELSRRAAELARSGQIDDALELEGRADLLRAKARDERREKSSVPVPNASGGKRAPKGEGAEGMRALTISALVEIGVPASPRAIAEYTLARFGKAIDHRAIASLRRDEWRAWSSPKSNRAVYVVPALEGRSFFPVRGKVALSDWSLRQRIIGPWSERVDHLAMTKNLARQLAWLVGSDSQAGERLFRVLASYAATVPGALAPDGRAEPATVERAVDAELGVLRPRDDEWRATAAQRAAEALDEAEQIWGIRPPGLTAGTGA